MFGFFTFLAFSTLVQSEPLAEPEIKLEVPLVVELGEGGNWAEAH